MKGLPIVLCATLILCASCQDMGTSYAGSYLGSFSYKAFDTLNVTVAEGTLTLFRDGDFFSGHWRFTDGRSGELKGSVLNDRILLNLNPQYIDNNLLLIGIISGNVFAGTWEQIGYPGVMARGTFRAIKL